MNFGKLIIHRLINYPKRELIKDIFQYGKFIIFFLLRHQKIKSLNNFEARFFSQNGEDGILLAIFHKIGHGNKYFVEFGVGDGKECNTRFLKEVYRWNGLWMDAEYKSKEIKQELVTKENVGSLFKKYKVPRNFDLLSIDIDGNDYWVWKAIKRYKPRVVVIEYNSSYPPPLKITIKYDPNFKKADDNYFGASLSVLQTLGSKKGYTLLACDSKGINAFFVKNDLVKNNFQTKSIEKIYKPPKYGLKLDGKYVGYKKSKKEMIPV